MPDAGSGWWPMPGKGGGRCQAGPCRVRGGGPCRVRYIKVQIRISKRGLCFG